MTDDQVEQAAPLFFDVGGRLKQLRNAKGLSQREVARRAGMTNANLSMIEQGKVSPSMVSLEKILAAFPVSLMEFFGSTPGLDGGVVKSVEAQRWQKDSFLFTGVQYPLDQKAKDSVHLISVCVPSGGENTLACIPNIQGVAGLLLSGRAILQLGDVQHELSMGDFFLLPPNRTHLLQNPYDATTELILSAYQKPQ